VLLLASNMQGQQLAFPEAQGWGRFATGGRYGSVYHVTNLNDSGAGSLRDAVSTKNRIIVFDVAGVINIKSRMTFASNIYVAGQSAPGEGITVYGNGVSFSGSTNSIIRYMRFRMGVGGDSGKDCAGVANGTNMIFDHCSFAWGRDETFSINSDGKGDLHSITLQNCIVGQGLMSHSAGGLMQADNITLYRNFYCDNSTRNNKVKGRNQYVNNLVYNWKDGAYIMGGDSEGNSYCNIVGNLFINGPMGSGNGFSGGNSNFHCYLKDNLQDSNTDGKYNPNPITDFAGSDVQATPYSYPELETVSAKSVIDNLEMVGASFPMRDYVDYYMVDECKTYGKEGALLSNEGSLPFGTPNTWTVWKGNDRIDTDKDGIPDEWEKIIGSDASKNDAMTIGADGYTNIERYLNLLPTTLPSELVHLRAPMLVEQTTQTPTAMQISWRDWTENEQGYIIETKTEGADWRVASNTSANTSNTIIKGLEPSTSYDVRIRAWGWKNDEKKDTVYSDYSLVKTFKTLPVETEMVDVFAYEPDAIWMGKDNTWNLTTQAWNTNNGLYQNGDKVLFNEGNITLDTDVNPDCIVVNNEDDILFDGTGKITGNTSLNKTGTGELTIKNTNSYTGATVCHEGTISFPILKDGGMDSSIGASQEYAQNWIFNGGKYNYTGQSTSTNRCAKVLKESTLAVSTAGRTITMNGTFEGKGNLVIDGKGTVQPNTTKFFGYTGKTILKGGTLHLPSADISNNGIGSSSGLVFAGGTLSTKGETEGYENYTFPIEVREGTTSVFSPNRNCYIKNKFTGNGTLQINFPYVREYLQGNFDSFKGRIIASATASGNLCLLNGKSIPNAVLELKNGIRVADWQTTGGVTLGGLSGPAGTYLSGASKQTNNFSCTWTVGTANTDETFNGIINNWSCSGSGHVGTVNIIKAGTGIWRLTGANDYKGTTTVNGGELIINGTHSGTGAVTVNKDAMLAGQGTIAGAVNIKSGGTLYVGDTLISKKLTIKGKLTVAKGGVICIPVSNGTTIKNNSLTLTGGISLTNATLMVDFGETDEILDLPVGTELKLFNITGTKTGSFSEIYPATPGEGKAWDTTDLIQKGILRVSEDPAVSIQGIDATKGTTSIYNLNGQPVVPNKRGIYISNGQKRFISK